EAFERRQYELGPRASAVTIFGEPIAFRLIERSQQIWNPPRGRGRAPRPGSTVTWNPSGQLSLRSYDIYVGESHPWSDTRTRRIEDRLNDFVVALVAEAVSRKMSKASRAADERRAAEQERKRYKERQRVVRFETDAAAWTKARQLRAYA